MQHHGHSGELKLDVPNSKSLGIWNLNPAVYTEWKPRGKVKTEILAICFHQGTTNLVIQNCCIYKLFLAAA